MISRKKEIKDLQFGAKTSLIAIFRIGLLSAVMAITGISTGMVVMVAAAVESTADMLALFATFIGLKISQKSADKGFRYGYYRVETLAALLVSIMIIFIGFKIFIESFSQFTEPKESSSAIINLIVIIVAMSQSRHLAKRLQKAGEKINSIALIACGKDKQVDFYVRTTVIIGIAANYFHIPYIEGIIAMGIAGLTLKVGVEIAKESIFFLLDYFEDKELIYKITETVKKHSVIVTGIHDIRMRRAGTVIFGEAILDILPYSEAGDIRNELIRLQKEIYKQDKYIKLFSLFTNIPIPKTIRIAVPVKDRKGLKSAVASNFEETTGYLFIDIKDKVIQKTNYKKFQFSPKDFNGIVKFFQDQKCHIVINNNMDSLLYYNLRHLKHFRIYPHFRNVANAEQTIKLLIIDL